MYFYIYDSYLSNSKYQPVLNRIESRLTDLGISGKIEKLSILKNLEETVRDIFKKEPSTLIIVGNDSTVSKVISLLPDLGVVLGIIPVGESNQIARTLGIPEDEKACDILSARIIEKLDLGMANKSFFISQLTLPGKKCITLDCGSYQINPITDGGKITIRNFSYTAGGFLAKQSNPKDGVLEAVLSPESPDKSLFGIFRKKYAKESIFPIKKMKIKCQTECLTAIADGHLTLKTPISIEVSPKRLKVIVGKTRMF